jgi:cytidylate kinase
MIVKRRIKENWLNLQKLKEELQKKDYQDKTRKISPLIIAEDS